MGCWVQLDHWVAPVMLALAVLLAPSACGSASPVPFGLAASDFASLALDSVCVAFCVASCSALLDLLSAGMASGIATTVAVGSP